MSFTAPVLLLALLLLPLLWWLLRATPPAPRAESFPAVRLLLALRPREETPARTPWWLLALRLSAAGLIIIGLAGPLLGGGGAVITGTGPLLLVIDNGFAAAPDWQARQAAAGALLDRMERAGRDVALLATAPTIPALRAPIPMPAALLRPVLAALQPMPWGTDRGAAARAIAALPPGPSAYLADGTASAGGAGAANDGDAGAAVARTPGVAGSGDAAFAAALAARGPVTELRADLPPRLLTSSADSQGLIAVLHQIPIAGRSSASILAETGDGRVLASVPLSIAGGTSSGAARIDLPPELRNQLSALRVAGWPGAGLVSLLDESARRRPVGVLDAPGAETPLLGDAFYIDRALAPFAELRHGDAAALLARPLSVLVAANRGLSAEEAGRVEAWVRQGGLLLRFAGPAMGAAEDDPLLPEKLLAGDRQLGGAMSWSQPQHLAAFPPGPFNGLPVPAEVSVSRQVLAEPAAAPPEHVWAALADGTPLVTAARHGAGEIVLFHVTANTDWSNLPLSGLFVEMMTRLVQRAAGVAVSNDARPLPPAASLDGAGVLGPPATGATSLALAELDSATPGPRHPPGFYGLERDRHAFNLGARISLAPALRIQGAREIGLDATPRTTPLGPWLLALALFLLAIDMAVTLRLRGLLRPALATMLLLAIGPAQLLTGAVPTLLLLGAVPAFAVLGAVPAHAAPTAEEAALSTRLAYISSGDAAIDHVAQSGLAGLTDYVNDHTAAVLAAPAAVTPGADELSFYPLLYWPVTATTTVSPGFTAALNDYMRHGGIVVIDTRDGGEGSAFAPGTSAALKRAAAGLDIPTLAPLTNTHVLAHAFYLLNDFPGRYAGATVWVQQAQDRSNDSVSPVIIGANDWAAAWATDEGGKPLYATIPGGARQRTLAWRFGVNMVMYALTGNYKGDQVHVPALLQRLGQ